MEEKLDFEIVKAQIEAVLGCAEGIEENIAKALPGLRPGMALSVATLRRTAESMLLEAMVHGE